MATKTAPAGVTFAMTPLQRVLAGASVCLANFMIILDLTIANVSVPHISGSLGITLDQGTWVITSYAVAEAICVPLTGWLSRRFGSVRLFIGAMLGFGLFSLLCGMSVTLGMLVACRIGQGFCGAPILSLSQALLVRIFPEEERGKALSYWSMTIMIAPALGPILGGSISDNWSWHWIFLINVPFAAILSVVAFTLLRTVETPTAKVPIDTVGLGLLIFWIACFQIMLDIGRDRDWFESTLIVLLAIGGGIGFVAFIIWELTDEHPIVNLRILRYRGFTFVVGPFAIAYAAMFGSFVIIPQWLQTSLGYSATQAGMVTATQAVSGFLVSIFVARIIPRVNLRVMMSVGIMWMGVSALVRAGWTSAAGIETYLWPVMLQGLGIPLMVIAMTTMSMSAVRPDEVAAAAGLQTFVRTTALAASTAVSMTFWGNAQRTAQTEMAGSLHPQEAQSVLERAGMTADETRRAIASMVDTEAATLAMDQLFWITGSLFFLAAIIVLFGPDPKKVAGGRPD